MMAAGEIRLSTTTMRRMPVLAQSQSSGGGLVSNDPNDLSAGVTATAQSGGATVSNDPNNLAAGIIAVGYNQSALHDLIVAQMTDAFRKAGATVVNGPVICLPGSTPCGQPDLMVGVGRFKRLFAVEVKTGSLYDLTPGQVNIYPHLPGGGSLIAGDNSLAQFGIVQGQALPPIPLMFYVQGVIDGQGYWLPGFPQQ